MANKNILGLFSDAATAAGRHRRTLGGRLLPGGLRCPHRQPLSGGSVWGENPGSPRLRLSHCGRFDGPHGGRTSHGRDPASLSPGDGRKPILAIPAMTIISYEATLLGAVLFTILGIIFESPSAQAQVGPVRPAYHGRVHWTARYVSRREAGHR